MEAGAVFSQTARLVLRAALPAASPSAPGRGTHFTLARLFAKVNPYRKLAMGALTPFSDKRLRIAS